MRRNKAQAASRYFGEAAFEPKKLAAAWHMGCRRDLCVYRNGRLSRVHRRLIREDFHGIGFPAPSGL